MPSKLRNYTISYTEPYELETFQTIFPTQQFATNQDNFTEAAFNPDHPCVVANEPLFMFVQCQYCGKILAKNRREMRRNIKHRHITAVFCGRGCSWQYYNKKNSPHDAHAESKHEHCMTQLTSWYSEKARRRSNYERHLKKYHDDKRNSK